MADGQSNDNTVEGVSELTGNCGLVGDVDRFDEDDEKKFRRILKKINLSESDANGAEFEGIGKEWALRDIFRDPFDDLPASDEIFDQDSQPAAYLVLCELLGEEPHENPQTCAVCAALAEYQCPWARSEDTEDF